MQRAGEELVQIISEELKLRIEGGELKETSGPRIEDMYSVRIIGINRRIIEWAKSVFMITAISQNGKLDTVSVLYMNYKMIEDVIMASGFPAYEAAVVPAVCQYPGYFINDIRCIRSL